MTNDYKLDGRVSVLPLRDIVVFPHMIVPLFVGREKSVRALDHVMAMDQKQILLLSQKDASEEHPRTQDLFSVGTLATVMQVLKLPDGTVKILVEGIKRVRVLQFIEAEDFFEAHVQEIPETLNDAEPSEVEAMMRTLLTEFENYVKLNNKIPPDVLVGISQLDDPHRLSDTLASYLSLKISEKQELLETSDLFERMEKMLEHLEKELGVLQVEKKIRTRVKKQMEKTQRDYYLNEQLKAIQKELGDNEEGKDEVSELSKKVAALKMPKEALEKCQSELKKLKNMNQMSSEATVIKNYLDWMVSIPWANRTKVKKNITEAQSILNKDHYGLEKVKERILEYLAVQSRVGKIRSQILCLVGPPGVGKTSLGKSIAKATGRNFVRVALGGVRDEAEVRGHRRTYIGSMPGKIIQGMKKAKSSNPLFLLDEIDKLGNDWRGDPSSALLEVLDPEQNGAFNDHYLEVDYDLSDVMFVTTSNSLNIPGPLLDRMEVIRLSGYTEQEKLEIAKSHLLAKQEILHGLKKGEFYLEDSAILSLIRYYTREAGVRNLEREVANLCRKAVKLLVTKKVKSLTITAENLKTYAGVPRFHYGMAEEEDSIGVTTGLAWTEVGGDLLSIEVVSIPGQGKLKLTGKLGDVMQESAQASMSFVRSQAKEWGIDSAYFEKRDFHIHVPEGATPKDGPSAGITITTSLVSAITGIAVKKDVAMTGEITLRGHVLAIGGLKEKLLAALIGGIKTVIIPYENEKDLEEVPEIIKKDLKIIPIKNMVDVLEIALIKSPVLPPVKEPLLPGVEK
ncbi:MAG TPA: endopeptidase La [Alphaproteobacteria bacterium]|nr:endopeptidase La [Alphaproteobacteria bacterium]